MTQKGECTGSSAVWIKTTRKTDLQSTSVTRENSTAAEWVSSDLLLMAEGTSVSNERRKKSANE